MRFSVFCLQVDRGALYFRVAVPADLRAALGRRRELRRSLEPLPLAQAVRCATLLRARVRWLFYALRKGLVTVTAEELSRLITEWIEAGRREDYRERVDGKRRTRDDLEEEEDTLADFRATLLEELATRTHLEPRTGRNRYAEAILEHHGLAGKIAPGSEDYRTIAYEGQRAYIEYLQEVRDTLYRPAPKYGAAVAPHAPRPGGTQTPPRVVPLFSEAVDAYVKDPDRDLSASKAADKYRLVSRLLCAHLGDRPVADYTPDDIVSFRDEVLRKVPPNRSKAAKGAHAALAKATTTEAKQAALGALVGLVKGGAKPLAGKTLHGYIGAVGSVFSRACLMHWRQDNPAEAAHISRERCEALCPGETRRPYTPAELQSILNSVVAEKALWPRHPWRPWVVVIGLYSGMRLDEIAQLQAGDIQQVEGVWCVDYRQGGKAEHAHLKTGASHRLIPLHDELLSLGFMRLVENAKGGALFPALEYHDRHGYGRKVQRWFSTELLPAAFPGGVPKGACFHAFRHTFTNASMNAGVDLRLECRLVGHGGQDSSKVHRGYEGEAAVKRLKGEAMDRVTFAIDLGPLRAAMAACSAVYLE